VSGTTRGGNEMPVIKPKSIAYSDHDTLSQANSRNVPKMPAVHSLDRSD